MAFLRNNEVFILLVFGAFFLWIWRPHGSLTEHHLMSSPDTTVGDRAEMVRPSSDMMLKRAYVDTIRKEENDSSIILSARAFERRHRRMETKVVFYNRVNKCGSGTFQVIKSIC